MWLTGLVVLLLVCRRENIEPMAAVDLRGGNQVTVPMEICEALHIGVGDLLDFQVDDDGDVHVRGLKVVPADQAWFWTPEWQKMEREADESLAAGRIHRFHSEEEMDEWLDSLVANR